MRLVVASRRRSVQTSHEPRVPLFCHREEEEEDEEEEQTETAATSSSVHEAVRGLDSFKDQYSLVSPQSHLVVCH